MLHKIKLSFIMLPMVVWIGSYFVPAEFSRNTYYKDAAEIENVISAYADAFYEADQQKFRNLAHSNFVKRGSRYNVERGSYEHVEEIDFSQLVEQAGKWNKENIDKADPVKHIVIYDIQDISATARLTAAWGIEYFHLSKIDGKWYIMNALWQSPHLP